MIVNHSDVDLVSICVRVPFHHQMGMAGLNAGKHLFCEWPLAATTDQAAQMHQLAASKGLHHMVGLQARGAPAINRARDLVAEGYLGRVLSSTMIIATPNWGTEFTLCRAYLADRATGATLMTIPGGHSIDALCFCLGEFKEVASVVATQRKQIRIVETGEMIPMTSPDQVLVSGVLEGGAVASVHVKGGTANGTGFLFEIHGSEGDIVIAPRAPRAGSSMQISDLALRGSQGGKPLPISQSPRVIAGFHPPCRRDLPSMWRNSSSEWLTAFATVGPSVPVSILRSRAIVCSTQSRRLRIAVSARSCRRPPAHVNVESPPSAGIIVPVIHPRLVRGPGNAIRAISSGSPTEDGLRRNCLMSACAQS
jgi:predicted dehydrogenase